MLLAYGRDHMRVAIPGHEDTVEFRRADGYWRTEDGEQIELESVIMTGEFGIADFGPEPLRMLSAVAN